MLTLEEELDVVETVAASVCVEEVERVDKVEPNPDEELVPAFAITFGDKFWGAFLASAANVSIVRDLLAAGLILWVSLQDCEQGRKPYGLITPTIPP